MKRVTVKIAGPAGMGIKSAGLVLAKMVVNEGYYFADYSEYPSLVRGGHNTYQATISNEEVWMVDKQADILISLVPGHEEDKKNLVDIPLTTMTAQLGGQIFANTISLGTIAFILGLNKDKAKKIIAQHFGLESKNPEAFDIGYKWGEENRKQIKLEKPNKSHKNTMIVDGNEAAGWGMVKGGCNFFAAYPMTPATGVLHFLAKNQDEFKITVVHPEDEIAVANQASGASIAGARAAVATSGGGFALMNETVSFNGITDSGVVYFVSQRPGPATGMPTWTAQGELLYSIFAGHGEFPKIVLAPGDTWEAFEVSKTAMNLANQFDVPVIVLADKMLSESSKNIQDLAAQKKEIVESKKIVPGKGIYLYNSYEHNDEGFSIEDSETARKAVEARLAKINKIKTKLPKVNFFGSKKAKKIVVSWGSTKGAILEALRGKEEYAYLQIISLWPLNKDVGVVINSFKEKILVENNATGQLGKLLKMETGVEFDKTILKYDGRPFFPNELKEELK